ncbi:hypothetical protein [Paenibacillus qinlingensis]|uniref:Type II secretion system protein GspF domain-containing protein n=1 Tax=Paenibacillus qinlingensis TaxID=1837343 RepID=A0ABU1NWR3_9BACL|nr:hypothetical protein [Paenibacillus qinlingensis]MDR6551923.1 hypothetical protein [Paenibacillus qinlingensis]
MVMVNNQLLVLQYATRFVLFMLVMLMIYHVLKLIPVRKRRWRSLQVKNTLKEIKIPSQLYTLLGMSTKVVETKRQLLLGCGIWMNANLYEGARRLLLVLAMLIGVIGYAAFKHPWLALQIQPAYVLVSAVVLSIFLMWDQKVLTILKEKRSQRIVRDIYAISRQLLYYNDSKLNLHDKLSLCVGQTTSIRAHVELLLNEWYQGAEEAIVHFKKRLGTDEAHSFGETLNALRLNEHGDYYELLKQRIQDYKEKMELIRESKKETVSYVLFVLAGLPILNTFRVFMYPWIAEGQRLFDAIN